MNPNSENEFKFSRIAMSIRERHQRERRARREAILTAAARVFADHGLEGATIEMVAREAEVAVGTIYLYFCSRDDLYLNLIAERIRQIRTRYLDIKALKLEPLAELRAMTATYLGYLRESRGLFLTQLSVAQSQILKRLKRKAEIDNFKRVMALSREVFGLWESAVGRVYENGLIQSAPGGGTGFSPCARARVAAILWASLNGAFLLTGDAKAFGEVTGLDPDNFIEETFEFQLDAARARRRNGGRTNGGREQLEKAAGRAARPTEPGLRSADKSLRVDPSTSSG